MERAAQGAESGGGSNSSSRSSSRATSAGSSPSCSLAGRGVSGRSAAAGLGGGGSRSSPGSVAASPCGGSGRRREPALEGVLSKYTNLLQGWQNRYFVLDFEAGILQYFVNEQSKHQKPRGALSLSGAIVSLSDEAPHMLVVYAANGEMYKLRAADAKEKQFWVTQLRACAKYHMETNSKTTPSSRSRSLTLLPHGTSNSASPSSQRHLSAGAPGVVTITHHKSPAAARRAKSQYSGQLHEVREMMTQVEGQQKNLVHAIESLPGSGPLTALDQDLLLLKATSAATLSCLGECLSLLQQSLHHAGQSSHRPGASESILGWHGPKSHSTEQLKNGTLGSLPSASASITWAILPNSTEDEQAFPPEPEPEPEPNSGPELVLSEDEKSDTEDQEETELGVMEDQRSVILHLISQLKLGMDLTKVVLPTFILEKRSLLEMYADFLAHPDLLLAVAAGATPQDRVIGFVEYYLTAFHEGRKGALAKKPYNPIIGETFHCSWEVPKDKVKARRTAPPAPAGHEHPMADDSSKNYKLRFVAEQVSHHPPISCFYCECKEKRLCVNTHVWTKSKFMGMSVGVSMIGEGVLRLLEHGEEYVFTLPSAYARSILTLPWVELGGKVSITCAKTGYSATVIFHTKPFYGGKVHRVTAEVKHNPTNTIVCKAHGEWNGTLEFTYNNGETKVIDTTTLPVYPKKIRPLEKQGPMESRNLWREVTRCLRLGDMEAATEQKRRLEEKQRAEERKRENLRAPWRPKYFIQEGDGWVYFNPLWKAH
ncbi:oxysterol-binding protein-related protein 10 isoform X2 [Bos indicus]|uniref:Oxysterol-binding protein n=3 Tax=Bos TaxID=9903 RepID=A0A4W2G688_BOBOX|nr:oxysterol-binding protein-related protein 10 isoform X2 [Bos taurus]XP_027378067.1 oxysterol-binding protein-related protein 10 isoform X2 [Bos indicus x Bos taurus]XP_061251717.1 oxysterol-binding protein-related protein 10 isoform X1 [Bos javanicus]DAA17220.1 TPA: oxysterol binding protein-like 10 [Bos taurus]